MSGVYHNCFIQNAVLVFISVAEKNEPLNTHSDKTLQYFIWNAGRSAKLVEWKLGYSGYSKKFRLWSCWHLCHHHGTLQRIPAREVWLPFPWGNSWCLCHSQALKSNFNCQMPRKKKVCNEVCIRDWKLGLNKNHRGINLYGGTCPSLLRVQRRLRMGWTAVVAIT